MNNLITYLFFGIIWDVILHFISTITEGNNELSTKERIFSLVLWPITFIIFMYHFIKTFNNG